MFCIISDHAVSMDATEELAADVQVEHCTNANRAKKADHESLTRFFDLMGGLNETGVVFFVGGLVLLVTCFIIEKWRRTIVRKMDAELGREGDRK